MSRLIVSVVTTTLCLVVAGTARAECHCPPVPLDERIDQSVFIFTGTPTTWAPLPGSGASPYHTDHPMDRMLSSHYADRVTLFRIDTVWKGEPRRTVRVRHETGECGAVFENGVTALVFAVADPSGSLWTASCDVAHAGDANFASLNEALRNRLQFH